MGLVLGRSLSVTRDDSQRRFLAQHSVATLFRMIRTLFQHRPQGFSFKKRVGREKPWGRGCGLSTLKFSRQKITRLRKTISSGFAGSLSFFVPFAFRAFSNGCGYLRVTHVLLDGPRRKRDCL